MKKMKQLLVGLSLVLGIHSAKASSDKPEAMVYAASSLRDVMSEVASTFEKENKGRVLFNFAGSNTLAQQIVASPQADLFISANEEWMDSVEKAGHVVPTTRKVLFSNRLVFIANTAAKFQFKTPQDLLNMDFRFLSLANPEAVPAGKYAKAYLSKATQNGKPIWETISSKVAPALDVRSAMKLVEVDPSVIGIVYKTDALTSKNVKVLFEIPNQDIPPVHYSLAKINHQGDAMFTDAFHTFLSTAKAKDIFVKYGFIPLENEKTDTKKPATVKK